MEVEPFSNLYKGAIGPIRGPSSAVCVPTARDVCLVSATCLCPPTPQTVSLEKGGTASASFSTVFPGLAHLGALHFGASLM